MNNSCRCSMIIPGDRCSTKGRWTRGTEEGEAEQRRSLCKFRIVVSTLPHRILVGQHQEINMAEPPSPTLDRELTSDDCCRICSPQPNRVRPTRDVDLDCSSGAHGLGKPAAETEGERTPAVPIRRSVHRDYVVCLECGWRGQMLRRHLATGHGLTVEQYRARWNLPRDHPMTAPGYSERRSTLALELGLGRTRGGSAETTAVPEAVAETAPPPSPKRRGRPRTARS